ncbi:hypothetical protein CH063_03675 [Colletotrichum higginsianum]|uniref:Rhodopsin domain-containing protein n=1 Tax=Colletotrichum higginsianum (strain IMI 349063) TaxID=759273 RepID=H1VZM6_COLHI|nr:hypothetical protein CH063_03675 [Colletotrichum higginsianum]
MDLPQPSLEELSRDRSPIVVGVVSMCLIISTAILALRLWTRYYIVKKIGVDDYAAAFSLSCFWSCVFFHSLGHLSFKMSFLLQYHRVLCTPRMQGLYAAAMVLVASSGIGVVVTCFVFCVPLDGFWDQRVPARCLSQQVIFYVFGAGTIVTDIVIFLLPLPALSKLQIPRSQRFYLLGIFSLGFFIVGISVVRLQFLKIQPDFTWWNVDPGLWSIGELSAAMVCLCLPPLKILVNRARTTRTCPSRNASSRNFGALPSNAPLSPSSKITNLSTAKSSCVKPSSCGNVVVVETETLQDAMYRPTPALAV